MNTRIALAVCTAAALLAGCSSTTGRVLVRIKNQSQRPVQITLCYGQGSNQLTSTVGAGAIADLKDYGDHVTMYDGDVKVGEWSAGHDGGEIIVEQAGAVLNARYVDHSKDKAAR